MREELNVAAMLQHTISSGLLDAPLRATMLLSYLGDEDERITDFKMMKAVRAAARSGQLVIITSATIDGQAVQLTRPFIVKSGGDINVTAEMLTGIEYTRVEASAPTATSRPATRPTADKPRATKPQQRRTRAQDLVLQQGVLALLNSLRKGWLNSPLSHSRETLVLRTTGASEEAVEQAIDSCVQAGIITEHAHRGKTTYSVPDHKTFEGHAHNAGLLDGGKPERRRKSSDRRAGESWRKHMGSVRAGTAALLAALKRGWVEHGIWLPASDVRDDAFGSIANHKRQHAMAALVSCEVIKADGWARGRHYMLPGPKTFEALAREHDLL